MAHMSTAQRWVRGIALVDGSVTFGAGALAALSPASFYRFFAHGFELVPAAVPAVHGVAAMFMMCGTLLLIERRLTDRKAVRGISLAVLVGDLAYHALAFGDVTVWGAADLGTFGLDFVLFLNHVVCAIRPDLLALPIELNTTATT
jgi:hypothetical protein